MPSLPRGRRPGFWLVAAAASAACLGGPTSPAFPTADVPYPPPLTVPEGETPQGAFVVAGPGAQTVIVVGDPDPPKYTFPYWGGERILQRFLKAVTGVEVPIVHHAKFTGDPKLDTPETFRVFVGRQPALDAAIGKDLDAHDDDAYMIVARGRDLFICGKRYWGTHWAAYDLLERAAGCRWYLDEPRFWEPVKDGIAGIGDILPKAERVVIPANTRIVETPGYRTRWFMRSPAHSFRLRYRDRFVHNMEYVFDPAKYGKDHPDWYPLVKGTRTVPGPGAGQQFQPCVSNPGTVERAAEAAAEAFEKGEQCFGLGMNDSDVYCECEQCAAIAPAAITDPKQRIAYAFADWYNRVAARLETKYPDRRIGTLAYGVLSLVPPGSIRLHPMVVPYLTRDSAQLFDPPEQQEFRELVDRWAKIATRMGIYEYIYGHGFYVPRLYDRYLLPNIKDRYGVGCESFYAEAGPQWALDGPKYWLVAKLAWNHRYRIEDLKADFHRNMFGPAATEMRAYFDFLEETWCTQTLASKSSNYRWMTDPKQFEIFTPAKCDAALALLDKAAAKVAGDGEGVEAIRRRIDFFRDGISFTRRMSLRHAGDAGLRKLVDRPDGPPPAEALPLLEGWLEGGPVSAIYALKQKVGLDTTAPNSLAEFRYQWARDPAPYEAIHALAKRATAAALDGLADRSPAGIQTAVDAALAPWRKELGPAKAERALALVADVAAAGGTLVVRGAAAGPAPTIDGTIDPAEWGGPVYDGKFYLAYAADERSPHVTRVYARETDGKAICLAFDCEGDPAVVGGDVTDREASLGSAPKMVNDDAIAISFRKPGHRYFCAGFNAVGGVRAEEGVESAARKTDRGWQLEVKLPFGVATAARGELCISRYERMPTADGKGTTTQCTTLRPVGRAGNTIGNGNFDKLMAFAWGVTVVPDQPPPADGK